MPHSGGAIVFQPCKTGQLLARFDHLSRGVVFQIGQGFAVEFHRHLRERRMSRVRVGPTQVQNGVGEFPAFLFVEIANAQENLRDDVLVEPRLARRRNGGIFPGTQRAELVMLPSFSAKPAQGRR